MAWRRDRNNKIVMEKLKKISQVILLLGLLFGTLAFSNENGEKQNERIISFFLADIDEDGKEELLTIEAADGAKELETGERYGSLLCIYKDFLWDQHKQILEAAEPAYSFDLSLLKPLYVQAGDINGDGKKEISVVVYKETQFHPVPAKRPFFYALTDGTLEKIWLGSRLARPFDDFVLCDMDGDGIDEIISIESTQDGKRVLAEYDWAGFGFDMEAESESLEVPVFFTNKQHESTAEIQVETADGLWRVKHQDNRLILNPAQE